MSLIDVSFSIVLYNNNPLEVEALLRSIEKVSLRYIIFVIDNSPINILQSVVSRFKNSEYIQTGTNIGFGKAHNIGIQKAFDSSKYHVILNPDVTFDIGTIEPLYEFMEQNTDVGLVMPKILYEDGNIQKLCKLLPKPSDLIIRRFLRPISTHLNLDYELSDFDYKSIIEVPSLSGCFMFTRTQILNNVGGFDPRFFLYLEDFDLTRRIRKISKTVYFPYTSVIHRFDKASYSNPKMLMLHILSAIKYFNKWGWFFDKERDLLNKVTLTVVKSLNNK